MKIPIRYSYKVYPHSDKATDMSKKLNACTCGAVTGVLAFFWWMIWYIILGITVGNLFPTVEMLSLASCATLSLFFLLRAFIKKKIEAKIDEVAKADLQRALLNNFNKNKF